MAYNSYFPQFYQPIQYQPAQLPQNPPQMAANPPSQASNGITWVQGESAAKSHPVAAGQSVLLMDSESSCFYIKSMDQSGMPLPLRIFDYTERKSAHGDGAAVTKGNSEDFVSRAEFDEFREDVKRSLKGIRRPEITEEGEG